MRPTRRAMLAAATGAVVGIAGCSADRRDRTERTETDRTERTETDRTERTETEVSVPRARIDFDPETGSNEVTITYEGGDAVEGDTAGVPEGCDAAGLRIRVSGDGETRDECWTDLPLSIGDSYVVEDVESGDTVFVVWPSPVSDETELIAQYDVR